MDLKKILVVLVVLGLGALAMPVSNLFLEREAPEVKNPDPAFQKIAPVLSKKCMDCHSSYTKMPFYAKFPIARQLIAADIEEGLEDLDIYKFFISNEVSERDLAKLEGVVLNGSMPPLKYTAMHWDAPLNDEERADIVDWIKNIRAEKYSSLYTSKEFKGEAVQPLPRRLNVNWQKAKVGEQLFHDKRLSGNDTVSCATCHGLDKGGTDRRQYSLGINNQEGHINSPTVFNSRFNFVQFWDGRAPTLVAQASGPVHNPVEMGSNWDEAIDKLKKDPSFIKAFKGVYGRNYTGDNMADAIAEFERTLVTPSRFDQYLLGKADAITDEEKEGYELFKKQGCASCHYGVNFGGKSFEKMGKAKNYFKTRGKISTEDYGRFNVTKDEHDKYRFKVPTLRNVAVTQPYLHDGSQESLYDTVQVMADYQFGHKLSSKDAELIVKFLESLTGYYKRAPLQ